MMYSTYCVVINAMCASGSVVERLLAKEKVAGSIPVSRFFILPKMRSRCITHYLPVHCFADLFSSHSV